MDSKFLQSLSVDEKLGKLPIYAAIVQAMLKEEQEKNKYKSFIIDVCRDCGNGGSCNKGYHPLAFMKALSLDDIRKKFVKDALYILQNNGRRPEDVTYDDCDDHLFTFTHQAGRPYFKINKINFHCSPYVLVLRRFIKCVIDWEDYAIVFAEGSSDTHYIKGNLSGIPIWIDPEELMEVAIHHVHGDDYYVEIVNN